MEGDLAQRAPSQADSPAWAQFQAEADLRKAKIARLLQVCCWPGSAGLGQPTHQAEAGLQQACISGLLCPCQGKWILIQARCCAVLWGHGQRLPSDAGGFAWCCAEQ